MKVNLSDGQLATERAFLSFLANPDEKYFMLLGSAGCGKSFLTEYLLSAIEQYKKTMTLLGNAPKFLDDVVLTATTHKACGVLSKMLGEDVSTIHSALEYVMQPNFKTGEYSLVKKRNRENTIAFTDALLFIDEASFIGETLFDIIDKETVKCKVVLIGDPYQLPPVEDKISILQDATFPKSELTEVMRNQGNILKASHFYRDIVKTQQWGTLPFVGDNVQSVGADEFQELLQKDFVTNYVPNKAIILCWRNDTAIAYNRYVRSQKGLHEQFEDGEVVQANRPIIRQCSDRKTKVLAHTDQVLVINGSPQVRKVGNIPGHLYSFRGAPMNDLFMADDRDDEKAFLNQCKKDRDWQTFYEIKETWLDIRPAYAQTVHKSQGSTYDTVYINLVDIGECFDSDIAARLLYVAISRASNKVYINGNLPLRYR